MIEQEIVDRKNRFKKTILIFSNIRAEMLKIYYNMSRFTFHYLINDIQYWIMKQVYIKVMIVHTILSFHDNLTELLYS